MGLLVVNRREVSSSQTSLRMHQPLKFILDLLSPAIKVRLSLKLSTRHVCRPSLLGARYTIQHVGCCELICDLYQSFPHQLWVGSTSVACEDPVKFSTGVVCSPSHVPPPCWRTHYAISISLITPQGAAPASLSVLFLFLSLPLSLNVHTQKLQHPYATCGMQKPCLSLHFIFFLDWSCLCLSKCLYIMTSTCF